MPANRSPQQVLRSAMGALIRLDSIRLANLVTTQGLDDCIRLKKLFPDDGPEPTFSIEALSSAPGTALFLVRLANEVIQVEATAHLNQYYERWRLSRLEMASQPRPELSVSSVSAEEACRQIVEAIIESDLSTVTSGITSEAFVSLVKWLARADGLSTPESYTLEHAGLDKRGYRFLLTIVGESSDASIQVRVGSLDGRWQIIGLERGRVSRKTPQQVRT